MRIDTHSGAAGVSCERLCRTKPYLLARWLWCSFSKSFTQTCNTAAYGQISTPQNPSLEQADVKILQQVDVTLAALPEEARLKDVAWHLGTEALTKILS